MLYSCANGVDKRFWGPPDKTMQYRVTRNAQHKIRWTTNNKLAYSERFDHMIITAQLVIFSESCFIEMLAAMALD